MARIVQTEIHVIDPRSGVQVGMVPCTAPGAVEGAVAQARKAQAAFAARPLAERKRVVRALAAAVMARADRLAEALVTEIGKPAGEAWTSELVTTQELFDYWLEAIDDALEPMPLELNPLNYPGKEVEVRLDPIGVVGMIMPWNYPVNLPLRTIVPALLAGNAVVWKPSEHAATCGATLAEAFAEALPEGLVTTVQGGPEQGVALIDAEVDKIVFVGSVSTGRAVAARCAERLIPVSLELGSKDPAIVLKDADLERAAHGIVWGAFHNAGQDCASVERVYVHRSVADAFVQRVVAITQGLRLGADVGPLVNESQLAKVDAHVQAALVAGARALTGGKATGTGFFYEPTVLVDVTEDMDVFREETFGPVLPIAVFDDEDEAVARANASPYGLCASVWSRDVKRAERLVLRIDCGSAFVNNCCFTGPMGGAAWSGRKQSGGGVTGSRFGLDALVRPRTVCIDRSRGKREMWWYPYGDALVTMARGLVELGRSGGAKVAGARMAVTGLINRWK